MAAFSNKDGIQIVEDLVCTINESKQYLSDIDGQIGDGDHGINMSKGFTKAGEAISRDEDNLSSALKTLGGVLMDEIGGAMGPLYGTFFRAMFRASKKHEQIDENVLSEMLNGALEKVRALGNAEPGDKTLVDTLMPAVAAFDAALARGKDLSSALGEMKAAAEKGRDSTKDLVARKGRASRLGERSKGVLDPGATSCCLILSSMAGSVQGLIS